MYDLYHNAHRAIFKFDVIVVWIALYILMFNYTSLSAVKIGLIAAIGSLLLYCFRTVKYIGYLLKAFYSIIITLGLAIILPVYKLPAVAAYTIIFLLFVIFYRKHGGFDWLLHKLFPDDERYMNDQQWVMNYMKNYYAEHPEEVNSFNPAKAKVMDSEICYNEQPEQSEQPEQLISVDSVSALFGIDIESKIADYEQFKEKLLDELSVRLDSDTVADVQYMEFDNTEDVIELFGNLPESCYISSLIDREKDGIERYWPLAYEVLTLKHGTDKTPYICLAKLYEDYDDIQKAADNVMVLKDSVTGEHCINYIYNYDKVKGRLIASFASPEDTLHLSKCVCNTVWGLPVIYTLVEPNSDRKSGCYVPVTLTLADIWNVSVDELHACAVDNLTNTFRISDSNGYWQFLEDLELKVKFAKKCMSGQFPNLYHYGLLLWGETHSYTNGFILSREVMNRIYGFAYGENKGELMAYVIVTNRGCEFYYNNVDTSYIGLNITGADNNEKWNKLLPVLKKSLSDYDNEYSLCSKHIYLYNFDEHSLTMVT